MPRTFNRFCRVIAAVTLICFSSQTVFAYSLPQNVGTVQSDSSKPNSKNAILILNAHTSSDAQKNISELLKYFKTQGIDLIGLEGAGDKIDGQIFRSFPDKEALAQAAWQMVQEGTFTGAEYFYITAEKLPNFFGLEDKTVYLENRDAFLKTTEAANQLHDTLDALNGALISLKKKTYSRQLFEFDEKVNHYQGHSINYLDHVRFLVGAAKKAHLNLPNFQNLYALSKAVEQEKKLSHKGLRKDLEKIRLSFGDDTLFQEIVALVTGQNANAQSAEDVLANNQKIHSYFNNLIQQGKLDSKKFEHFSQYFEWLSLFVSFDSTKLFDETDQIMESIYERFSQSDEDKKLIQFSKSFGLFQKMISLQLTQKEWEQISAGKDSVIPAEAGIHGSPISAIRNGGSAILLGGKTFGDDIKIYFKSISDSDLALIHSAGSNAQRFYELAEKRNHIFAERIAAEMNRKKKDTSVIVIGGFHEKGLKAALKAKGISTTVIAPKIGDALSDIPYMDRMLGKPTELETSLIQASTLENALKISDLVSNVIKANAAERIVLGASIINGENGTFQVQIQYNGKPLAVNVTKNSDGTYKIINIESKVVAAPKATTSVITSPFRGEAISRIASSFALAGFVSTASIYVTARAEARSTSLIELYEQFDQALRNMFDIQNHRKAISAWQQIKEKTQQSYNRNPQFFAGLRAGFQQGDLERLKELMELVRAKKAQRIFVPETEKLKILERGPVIRDLQFFSEQPDLEILAIDNATESVSFIETNFINQAPANNIRLAVADMEDINAVPANTFHVVRDWASLHHIPIIDETHGADAAVKQAYRALQGGGIYTGLVKAGKDIQILDTKNKEDKTEGMGPRFYQFFTKKKLTALLKRNGFIKIKIKSQNNTRGERQWFFMAEKPITPRSEARQPQSGGEAEGSSAKKAAAEARQDLTLEVWETQVASLKQKFGDAVEIVVEGNFPNPASMSILLKDGHGRRLLEDFTGAFPAENFGYRWNSVVNEQINGKFKATLHRIRAEARKIVVSTTSLNPTEELDNLRLFLAALENEPAQAPKVVVISDQHGTIDKFDALIVDAIRSVLPDGKLPPGFKLNSDKPLEEQLSFYEVDLQNNFDGRLYFHNLGDLMDRGPYGVKVFRRSLELINAGLSDFVIGNHDFWEFMNLQAFHLPWYQNYNFYDYTDSYNAQYGPVEKLVEQYHQDEPATRTKTWWAEKLAEYTAFHEQKQKDYWKQFDIRVNGEFDASGKKRKPGTGLFAQVSATLTTDQKKLWDQLRGWHLVDVYTGTRLVGSVSIKWWEDLARDFRNAAPDPSVDLPANQAWEAAIQMMEQEIIPELKKDLEEHLQKGDWWWRVFEAINYQNYTSPEWWAKDWVFHADWGTAVLRELNEDLAPSKQVTQANYLNNHTLQRVADFFRDHFSLYTTDIYQNVYMHAFLPVDIKTGEFYFTYKGVEYRGRGDQKHPSVWEGLDFIARDVRNREHSMSDIYEALSLVNSWYADNTTLAKPPEVAKVINQFGPKRLAEVNGFNRLFTGHIPFHEFSKLTSEKRGIIAGFQTGDTIIFIDHGMGTRFGYRGSLVSVSPEGLILRGFEHDKSNGVISHPRTIVNIEGPAGVTEEVLFQNPGIPKERFLPVLIKNVQDRINQLSTRSEARSQIQQTPEELFRLFIEDDGEGFKRLGVQMLNRYKTNPDERLVFNQLIEELQNSGINGRTNHRLRQIILYFQAIDRAEVRSFGPGPEYEPLTEAKINEIFKHKEWLERKENRKRLLSEPRDWGIYGNEANYIESQRKLLDDSFRLNIDYNRAEAREMTKLEIEQELERVNRELRSLERYEGILERMETTLDVNRRLMIERSKIADLIEQKKVLEKRLKGLSARAEARTTFTFQDRQKIAKQYGITIRVLNGNAENPDELQLDGFDLDKVTQARDEIVAAYPFYYDYRNGDVQKYIVESGPDTGKTRFVLRLGRAEVRMLEPSVLLAASALLGAGAAVWYPFHRNLRKRQQRVAKILQAQIINQSILEKDKAFPDSQLVQILPSRISGSLLKQLETLISEGRDFKVALRYDSKGPVEIWNRSESAWQHNHTQPLRTVRKSGIHYLAVEVIPQSVSRAEVRMEPAVLPVLADASEFLNRHPVLQGLFVLLVALYVVAVLFVPVFLIASTAYLAIVGVFKSIVGAYIQKLSLLEQKGFLRKELETGAIFLSAANVNEAEGASDPQTVSSLRDAGAKRAKLIQEGERGLLDLSAEETAQLKDKNVTLIERELTNIGQVARLRKLLQTGEIDLPEGELEIAKIKKSTYLLDLLESWGRMRRLAVNAGKSLEQSYIIAKIGVSHYAAMLEAIKNTQDMILVENFALKLADLPAKQGHPIYWQDVNWVKLVTKLRELQPGQDYDIAFTPHQEWQGIIGQETVWEYDDDSSRDEYGYPTAEKLVTRDIMGTGVTEQTIQIIPIVVAKGDETESRAEARAKIKIIVGELDSLFLEPRRIETIHFEADNGKRFADRLRLEENRGYAAIALVPSAEIMAALGRSPVDRKNFDTIEWVVLPNEVSRAKVLATFLEFIRHKRAEHYDRFRTVITDYQITSAQFRARRGVGPQNLSTENHRILLISPAPPATAPESFDPNSGNEGGQPSKLPTIPPGKSQGAALQIPKSPDEVEPLSIEEQLKKGLASPVRAEVRNEPKEIVSFAHRSENGLSVFYQVNRNGIRLQPVLEAIARLENKTVSQISSVLLNAQTKLWNGEGQVPNDIFLNERNNDYLMVTFKSPIEQDQFRRAEVRNVQPVDKALESRESMAQLLQTVLDSKTMSERSPAATQLLQMIDASNGVPVEEVERKQKNQSLLTNLITALGNKKKRELSWKKRTLGEEEYQREYKNLDNLLIAITYMVTQSQEHHFRFKPVGGPHGWVPPARSNKRIEYSLMLGVLKNVTILGKVWLEDGKLTESGMAIDEKNFGSVIHSITEAIWSSVPRNPAPHYEAIWAPGYTSFTVKPPVSRAEVRTDEVRNESGRLLARVLLRAASKVNYAFVEAGSLAEILKIQGLINRLRYFELSTTNRRYAPGNAGMAIASGTIAKVTLLEPMGDTTVIIPEAPMDLINRVPNLVNWLISKEVGTQVLYWRLSEVARTSIRDMSDEQIVSILKSFGWKAEDEKEATQLNALWTKSEHKDPRVRAEVRGKDGWLVLTRFENERVFIDHTSIIVQVEQIFRDSVKLSILAPRETIISIKRNGTKLQPVSETAAGALTQVTLPIDEIITIGENIQLRVNQIMGSRVRLATKAPRTIDIVREEVYDPAHPRAEVRNTIEQLIEVQKDQYAQIAGIENREKGYAQSLKRLGNEAKILSVVTDQAVSEDERELIAKAMAFGKGSFFHFWHELDAKAKRALIAQLQTLDIEETEKLFQHFIVKKKPSAEVKLTPDNVTAPQVYDVKKQTPLNEQARELGRKAYENGEVTFLELAGGSGSRLHFDHPKIMFPASQVMNKSLGLMRAERIRALAEESGKPIPWMIMTSDVTHEETLDFFKQNIISGKYFGQVPQEWVKFIRQRVMPQVTSSGEYVLEGKNKIVVGGFGHGDARDWVLRDPEIQKWLTTFGTKYVIMLNVDNAFMPAAEPITLGLHIISGQDIKPGDEHLSVTVVEKTKPAENVGLSVLLDGKDAMLEYNQFPSDLFYFKYIYQIDSSLFVIYKHEEGSLQMVPPDSLASHAKTLGLAGKELEEWFKTHLMSLDQLPDEVNLQWAGKTYTKEMLELFAHLWLRLGNINSLTWSLSTFTDKDHPLPGLPVVVAGNKAVAGYDPESGEFRTIETGGVKTNKFEVMAFHGFLTGESKGAHVMVPRVGGFAPIKEAEGADTPEAAAQLFNTHDRNLLVNSPIHPWDVSTEGARVELSPAFVSSSGYKLSDHLGINGSIGPGTQIYLSGRQTYIGQSFQLEPKAQFILRVDEEYNPEARVKIGDNVKIQKDVSIHLKGSGRVEIESGAVFDYPLSITLENGEWLYIGNGIIQEVKRLLEQEDRVDEVKQMYVRYLEANELDKAFLVRKLVDSFVEHEAAFNLLHKNAVLLQQEINAIEASRRAFEQDLQKLEEPLQTQIRTFLSLKNFELQTIDGTRFRFILSVSDKPAGKFIAINVNNVTENKPVAYFDFQITKDHALADFDNNSNAYDRYNAAIDIYPKEYQHRNIGSILVALGLYVAKSQGVQKFDLYEVSPDVAKFFETLGFAKPQLPLAKSLQYAPDYTFDLTKQPLPALPSIAPARAEVRGKDGWLVLTRFENERVFIDHTSIIVQVEQIFRDSVKLSILAPRETIISIKRNGTKLQPFSEQTSGVLTEVTLPMGEPITIGINIQLKASRIVAFKSVRLAIKAPKSVGIFREEIYRPTQPRAEVRESEPRIPAPAAQRSVGPTLTQRPMPQIDRSRLQIKPELLAVHQTVPVNEKLTIQSGSIPAGFLTNSVDAQAQDLADLIRTQRRESKNIVIRLTGDEVEALNEIENKQVKQFFETLSTLTELGHRLTIVAPEDKQAYLQKLFADLKIKVAVQSFKFNSDLLSRKLVSTTTAAQTFLMTDDSAEAIAVANRAEVRLAGAKIIDANSVSRLKSFADRLLAKASIAVEAALLGKDRNLFQGKSGFGNILVPSQSMVENYADFLTNFEQATRHILTQA